MQEGRITEYLTNYIQQNHIPVELIVKHTGISEDRLSANAMQKLSASEFLELCAYLGVSPEEVRQGSNL